MRQPAEQIIKQTNQTASLIRAAQAYRHNLEKQLAAQELTLEYPKKDMKTRLRSHSVCVTNNHRSDNVSLSSIRLWRRSPDSQDLAAARGRRSGNWSVTAPAGRQSRNLLTPQSSRF